MRRSTHCTRSTQSWGPAGADWLKTAVVRIGRSFSVAQLDKHLRQDSATQGTEDAPSTSDGVSEAQQERALAEEQPWTPLKIDRDSEDFKEAVTASEAALREIEGSNGYATTEPEERNGIISVLRGTIDAIKKGSPSRAAVVHGLLWPLKFIAKKFAETTMGEISKVAAAKVMEWLSSLGSGIF
jgi:hypothetical protein